MHKPTIQQVIQIIALICCIIMLIILSIDVTKRKNTKDNDSIQNITSDQKPALTIIEQEDKSSDNTFNYIIDRRTGVVYLSQNYYGSYSMTAMINPDGTAITADQLGLEYEPYK